MEGEGRGKGGEGRERKLRWRCVGVVGREAKERKAVKGTCTSGSNDSFLHSWPKRSL